MHDAARDTYPVLAWIAFACMLAGIVLGAGCQMSTDVRDLEPARNQPPLEKLPGGQ